MLTRRGDYTPANTDLAPSQHGPYVRTMSSLLRRHYVPTVEWNLSEADQEVRDRKGVTSQKAGFKLWPPAIPFSTQSSVPDIMRNSSASSSLQGNWNKELPGSWVPLVPSYAPVLRHSALIVILNFPFSTSNLKDPYYTHLHIFFTFFILGDSRTALHN